MPLNPKEVILIATNLKVKYTSQYRNAVKPFDGQYHAEFNAKQCALKNAIDAITELIETQKMVNAYGGRTVVENHIKGEKQVALFGDVNAPKTMFS